MQTDFRFPDAGWAKVGFCLVVVPSMRGEGAVQYILWFKSRFGLYVAANDATVGVADEEDDFVAFFCGGEFGFDAFDCVGVVEA